MIQIKSTNSLFMLADKEGVSINMTKGGAIHIPARLVFQVLRGLISYDQKFHRKHEKLSK